MWERFCDAEEDLEHDMHRIYMDDLAEKAMADSDLFNDFVMVEVALEQQEAQAAYDAWWTWCAGDEDAWHDLEDVLSQFIDSIGMELHGEH